jgi:hypothetical protein
MLFIFWHFLFIHKYPSTIPFSSFSLHLQIIHSYTYTLEPHTSIHLKSHHQNGYPQPQQNLRCALNSLPSSPHLLLIPHLS